MATLLTDKNWQARSDASTLAEALEIERDKKRLAAAKKAAAEKVRDMEKVVDQHKKVAAEKPVVVVNRRKG